MRNETEELPEFEVTIFTRSDYKITKIANAINEYEAVLKVEASLESDLSLYYANKDYSVISVVRTD